MSISKRGFDRARSFEASLGPTKKPRTTSIGAIDDGGSSSSGPSSVATAASATNASNLFRRLKPHGRGLVRSKSEPPTSGDGEEMWDAELTRSSFAAGAMTGPPTEYDEGMYVYTDLLDTQDTTQNPISRTSSCLYNLAQMCIRRREYEEASKWLDLAYVRVTVDHGGWAGDNESMKLFMILHNRGYCAYRLGSLEESHHCYSDARAVCLGATLGQDALAATDVAIAILLFHSSMDNLEPALRILKATLPVYWIKYGASKAVGTLLNNLGRVQYMLQNYHAAEEAYSESLSIRRKCLDPNSIDIAATACNAGRAHHQLGHFDEAIALYRIFLEWARHNPDSNPRDVVIILKCSGDIFRERGDRIKAKDSYLEALAVGKRALGPFHPEVALSLCTLGRLHFEMQEFEASLDYYTQGLNVEKSLLSQGYQPQIVETLSSIAQIHRQRHDSLSAFLAYAEMYALQVQMHGPNALVLATTLSQMGLMEFQLKAYSAAFVLYQAALCIQRDHYGTDDHLCIASTLNSIGLVLFNKCDLELARECFIQSLTIRTKMLGPGHPESRTALYNVATAFLKSGFEDTAIRFYLETIRIERLSPSDSPPDVIVILTLNYLGLIHQERGELGEALEYFSEALALERKQNENSTTVGKLLNLIGNIHLRGGNVSEMMRCYVEAARLFRESGMLNESLIIAGISYYGLSKLHPPCAAQA